MTKRAIYYDTETTGVSFEKDRVIEIALFDATRETSFVSLIHPQCSIPKEASAIHGIFDEHVAQAPLFADIIPQLIEFCSGDTVLVAHNNDAFDVLFLKEEFKRAGVEFPQWSFFDSLKWARRYRPDLPRHSLQFLRESYGIEANQAHRALDDVIVLKQVVESMKQDLTFDTMIDLLNAPSKTSIGPFKMPFGKHAGKTLAEIPKVYLTWLKDSGILDKRENQAIKAALEQFLSTTQ